MTLSQAIRLGAMLHPQCHGALTMGLPTGEVLASCALGAAEQAGYDFWAFLQFRGVFQCQHCKTYWAPIQDVIVHLNDWHRWTRERIADQVEAWEQAQEGATPEVVVDSVEVTA